MRETPVPFYTLINTVIGEAPAVVVVNTALRTDAVRTLFPWHLRIGIACRSLGDNGMPTPEELEVVTRLETLIDSSVGAEGNAVFLARITARGERVLLYRVHDPEQANDRLQQLLAMPGPARPWEFQMEHDVDWTLAAPELDLPLQDPGVN
ncbi:MULTISPECIES: DUF695 domain-containing protein [Stenotrophomonas]|uniref:DUF695 domain-containing protein n=1 Tax=Stenotrophomonas TaxID=40323 RepID=UPI000D540EBE|nr:MULTISPECIES: DUF695 domain-containing protein [Stenotrophomonas]AWH30413.1 DUF695 domain-containing protein [Stenotrophomonas sp. YAU14A_MKIMI4_1]AWH34365.1 DUF695 domain-containing protein [Stenotrophomonas sp. SAU14A_NAIMI4_8]